MTWTLSAAGLSDGLALLLIVRLLVLRLHDVYRVFALFLLFEVVSNSAYFVQLFFGGHFGSLDYRVTWLALRIVAWILSLWMVYALLRAILSNLRGILKLSQRVLNIVLAVSIPVALLSARPEYLAAGMAGPYDQTGRAVVVAVVLERVIATVALLTLLLTLFFILWFPVKMPRNLAVFSIGFVVYFTAKTTLLLLHSFWSQESLGMSGSIYTLVLCACFVYWIIFLNRQGERVPVTLGHSWHASRQSQLVGELEALNATLARAVRR